jgi:hypothetical protein
MVLVAISTKGGSSFPPPLTVTILPSLGFLLLLAGVEASEFRVRVHDAAQTKERQKEGPKHWLYNSDGTKMTVLLVIDC